MMLSILLLAVVLPVVAGEPFVVVLNRDPGSIQLLSPQTMEIGPRVDLPGDPRRLVISSDGLTAYVSAVDPVAIYVIDISGGFMAEPAIAAVIYPAGGVVDMAYVEADESQQAPENTERN